ncbi:MAG TPA: HPF/RaiA family ribosome-associated protein [Bacteroidales bacterium]|jgi:putative sigma-54 modulation protein|nr:HPF/RaiA family ribosome-associated protein [Bacteroidales bacterium]HPB89680.1 HPF/RaiA family ribosome-associated protein [Bacteroidales bacterium]HPY22638.1 HPF/RaiA family ribosome-associated protein [Bacteroidales bacterium]HQA93039.1 HPF/RaiA family ribosome-associated protein [Bacteroidales bacterium]HQN23791.1 HPF/RaiA family ribosome-associated protein [Bacteroidales bacterium]
MEIKVQSIKFDADQKLLDFIDNKVGKIAKYYEDIVRTEVNLSLLADPQNKNVKVIVYIPGTEIIVEKNADTFEEAIVNCVGVLKGALVSAKEKRFK